MYTKSLKIGRYESGTGGEFGLVPVSKKGVSGCFPNWYQAYRNHKYVNIENLNTSIMWLNQKDYIARWLTNSSELSNYDINSSTSWGNYYDAWFQYNNLNGDLITKKRPSETYVVTGLAEYTRVNNIWDLAGNLGEWNLDFLENLRSLSGGNFWYGFYGDYGNMISRYPMRPFISTTITGSRISLTL